ncbi:MAG TPA: hypothetical protein VGV87_26925 [Blastocatellia bacterium]|nr:hypothetical protein [Blastocatellia bacterium]
MEDDREDRLRRQIEELVRSRLVVLEQDISRLQREVNESFTKLLERTDVATALPESDELLARIAADITTQLDTAGAESSRLGADIALLRDSIVELDAQHTQAEVLNALVARAANFAPRVVLFVVKGTNALAWAARGFEEGNTAIRGLSVSLQSDTVLRAALNSQQTFYGSSDQQPENHLIFSRLNNIEPQRVLAVTLRVRNKPAAVLYADSGEDAGGAVNVEANELLVHTAGLVIELVSLRTRMAEGTSNTGAAAKAAPQPAVSGPLPQPARTSAPLPQPAHSAPLTQPTGPIPQTRPGSGELPPRTGGLGELQPPPPVSVRQPEPVVPVSEPAVASAPSHAGEAAAVTARTGPLDEEEKLHNDARRFARLLVSEIKLYNEQKVADGRRHSDLYDRLKEDIDRSRQMYEKRVNATVAAKFDYFYDELVNTLAEGNPSRLGSDHPGPSVRA